MRKTIYLNASEIPAACGMWRSLPLHQYLMEKWNKMDPDSLEEARKRSSDPEQMDSRQVRKRIFKEAFPVAAAVRRMAKEGAHFVDTVSPQVIAQNRVEDEIQEVRKKIENTKEKEVLETAKKRLKTIEDHQEKIQQELAQHINMSYGKEKEASSIKRLEKRDNTTITDNNSSIKYVFIGDIDVQLDGEPNKGYKVRVGGRHDGRKADGTLIEIKNRTKYMPADNTRDQIQLMLYMLMESPVCLKGQLVEDHPRQDTRITDLDLKKDGQVLWETMTQGLVRYLKFWIHLKSSKEFQDSFLAAKQRGRLLKNTYTSLSYIQVEMPWPVHK